MAKVVVLDDDPHLRSLLCTLFNAVGATGCASFGSLSEFAAAKNQVLSADLIVLDVNLGPGLPSGLDAYSWLIEQGFGGRIIFLTGHARAHPLVQKASRLGSAKVYEKPLGIDMLESILKGRDDVRPSH